MANITLTSAVSVPNALVGVNTDPVTFYDWDVKSLSLTSSAAANDYIYTPSFDLNAINPKSNRIVFQKICNSASADVMSIQVSADGTNWFTAPLYNGGTAGGTAAASANIAELALTGLPSMRYARGVIQLITNAMSARTSMRLAMSFMRF